MPLNEISGEQIRSGMEKARWNGRFTILKKDPYLVVDGAHNPDAAPINSGLS